jgi:hypothetical protein
MDTKDREAERARLLESSRRDQGTFLVAEFRRLVRAKHDAAEKLADAFVAWRADCSRSGGEALALHTGVYRATINAGVVYKRVCRQIESFDEFTFEMVEAMRAASADPKRRRSP